MSFAGEGLKGESDGGEAIKRPENPFFIGFRS
jgi:hypothetical protein